MIEELSWSALPVSAITTLRKQCDAIHRYHGYILCRFFLHDVWLCDIYSMSARTHGHMAIFEIQVCEPAKFISCVNANLYAVEYWIDMLYNTFMCWLFGWCKQQTVTLKTEEQDVHSFLHHSSHSDRVFFFFWREFQKSAPIAKTGTYKNIGRHVILTLAFTLSNIKWKISMKFHAHLAMKRARLASTNKKKYIPKRSEWEKREKIHAFLRPTSLARSLKTPCASARVFGAIFNWSHVEYCITKGKHKQRCWQTMRLNQNEWYKIYEDIYTRR